MTRNKITIIVVIVILIAAGGFVSWEKFYRNSKPVALTNQNNNQQNQQSVLELAKQIPIKTFYISGTVTAISKTSVNFDANLGGSQGKVSLTAEFAATTPIYNEIKAKTKTNANALKIGQVINVSAAIYPYDQAQFAATEIDILK